MLSNTLVLLCGPSSFSSQYESFRSEILPIIWTSFQLRYVADGFENVIKKREIPALQSVDSRHEELYFLGPMRPPPTQKLGRWRPPRTQEIQFLMPTVHWLLRWIRFNLKTTTSGIQGKGRIQIWAPCLWSFSTLLLFFFLKKLERESQPVWTTLPP